MSYPVGTICIGQNFVHEPQFNGMECQVIAPIMLRQWNFKAVAEIGQSYCYRVRWSDGHESVQEHYYLRRKDWDDEDKRAEDRRKVSTLISTCKAAAEKSLAKREKV